MKTIRIFRPHRFHDFGSQFLRRNHLPAIDFSIFIRVHTPTKASRTEPTVFISNAVEIGIDIAVDLDTVLEVAPLIDVAITVGIGEPAKRLAIGIADQISIDATSFFDFARAFIEFGSSDFFVGNVGLARGVSECFIELIVSRAGEETVIPRPTEPLNAVAQKRVLENEFQKGI